QYEKAGLINNWDDNDKVKFLSIFLKDTAGTFLENLENIKTHWNWVELKNEFLNEFQPIGYSILLKTKLENRKQEDTESIMSFVTDIENLCRQVERNMKEEDICTYILKGLKEPILNAISLHDNSSLLKIKTNLKKYELMQFRINSRGQPGFNEYTDILNKQIMQVGKYSRDRVEELSAKIDQLSNSIKKVNFKDNPYNRENSNDRNTYRGFRDNSQNREERSRNYEKNSNRYRNNSPYPNKSNYENRERSTDRNYEKPNKHNYYRDNSYDRNFNRQNDRFSRVQNRDRSYSRDRNYDEKEIKYDRNSNRSRDNSRSRYYNSDYTRYEQKGASDRSRRGDYDDEYRKNESKKQYNRENSRERTPERYKGHRYEKEFDRVTCYRCNEKGHYADQCTNPKND
ncbi:serine/threonine-protein kinase fray2-like, partial [Aphis craccivora]